MSMMLLRQEILWFSGTCSILKIGNDRIIHISESTENEIQVFLQEILLVK